MATYTNETFHDLYLELETVEDSVFSCCTFRDCTFTDLTLYHCSFTECRFLSCTIVSLHSRFSTVSQVKLKDCTLRNLDWSAWKGSGFLCEPLDSMEHCFLQYNTFSGMDLRKQNFSGNELRESLFTDCRLTDASFRSCDLDGTEYLHCDLSRADFRDAFGYRINVLNNQMKGSRFSAAEAVRLLSAFGITVEP